MARLSKDRLLKGKRWLEAIKLCLDGFRAEIGPEHTGTMSTICEMEHHLGRLRD